MSFSSDVRMLLNEISLRSDFVQQGGDEVSLVTAYAALRPRGGFCHPSQEHMTDSYIQTI